MSFRIIEGLEQNTPEWLEFRKDKIGASDAPSIMGMSKFKTVYDLYEEKIFGLEQPVTPQMERGKTLESVARDWLNSTQNGNLFFKPVVIESLKYPGLIASLDAYCDLDGKPVVFEIKCPGQKDHDTALIGKVPVHYRPQLQHISLIIEGWVSYLSFDGKEGVILHEKPDLAFQQELLEKELAFLACMRNRTPPAGYLSCEEEIFDPKAIDEANEYVMLCQQIEKLENRRLALKEKWTSLATADRTIIGPLIIRKETRKGTVDYKSIPEISSVDLEKYRRPSIVIWDITKRMEYGKEI